MTPKGHDVPMARQGGRERQRLRGRRQQATPTTAVGAHGVTILWPGFNGGHRRRFNHARPGGRGLPMQHQPDGDAGSAAGDCDLPCRLDRLASRLARAARLRCWTRLGTGH